MSFERAGYFKSLHYLPRVTIDKILDTLRQQDHRIDPIPSEIRNATPFEPKATGIVASCQYSVSMKREDLVPIHTEAASQFAAFIPNVRVVNDGEAVEVASLIAGYDIRIGLLAE